jgi:hypothetical protein
MEIDRFPKKNRNKTFYFNTKTKSRLIFFGASLALWATFKLLKRVVKIFEFVFGRQFFLPKSQLF